MLYAEDFSPNTPQGACPQCQGQGRVYDATEASMVPDDSLTIRDRAIAAWPPAWHGQNLRDILVSLGHDVDKPWRELPRKVRDWILFTEETPSVPVYPGFTPRETKAALRSRMEPAYMGTFTSARSYVLHTFATTQSAMMRKRVAQYLVSTPCPACQGKRLKPEALAVTFAGHDIGALARLPIDEVARILAPAAAGKLRSGVSEEKRLAAQRLAHDVAGRLRVLQELGLGYLSLERSTPTLSPGELQRLRLATQLSSQLFGVIYVLDEPSAGLHPADGEALLAALQRLKASGNSVYVVEHDLR
jgi:excinuclease ABC subunit A